MKFDIVSKVGVKLGPKMGKLMLKGKAVAPDALVVGGLACVVVGTGLLVKRSMTTGREVLDEHDFRMEHVDKDDKKAVNNVRKNTVKELAKVYGLPLAMIVMGSGGVLYGRHLFKTRTLGLMATNTVLQSQLDKLSSRVDEELGEGTAKKFQNGIKEVEEMEEETLKNGKKRGKKVKKTVCEPGVHAMFFDQSSPLWHKDPTLNLMTIKNVEEMLTRKLLTKGYVFLEEAYDELKVPLVNEITKLYAHENGWSTAAGDTYVSFGVFSNLDEGKVNFINGYENVILLDPAVKPISSMMWKKYSKYISM